MKGFKDTTKMLKGHCFKANGGSIIAPMGARPMQPLMGAGAIRPIMPRPRVMPNIKMQSIRPPSGMGHTSMAKMPSTRLARGGVVKDSERTAPRDGGGGPYVSDKDGPSSATEKRGGKLAYSDSQRDLPDSPRLRPNYAKGGMKINPKNRGKFTRAMGKKPGHLTDKDVQRGMHSKSGLIRKEANFARMARRRFKPLAKGGPVCDPPGTARREVFRHVATSPPQGHGVRAGNLAFMREPMFKGGRKCD